MAKLISKTYGDALFELGIEKNSIEVLFEEAKAVLESIKNNGDLLKFLNNPQIESEEKQEVISNIFKQFVSVDMMGFLKTIVEKGRQNNFIEIFEYFIGTVKEYKHIGVVYVTTPLPLQDSARKAIEDKLLATTSYKSLEMNYSIDESLIGGMVIRIGDRVVDSSIKSKIGAMTKELMDIQLA